jgi:ATP-dependent phosphofructokinase / diphosphate-dependent phosphofructokinase
MPYDVAAVAEAIRWRSKRGKRFSIVAVAEGALSKDEAVALQAAASQKRQAGTKGEKKQAKAAPEAQRAEHTWRLARQLEELTGLESRVTILGYVQRGGAPLAADRLLATRLGTACAALIKEGVYGVMVAARGDRAVPVPLEEVVGKRRIIPLDHPWLESARRVGTCLGE